MKYWPVPQSYSKEVPPPGFPGSFWEGRKDRCHAGIDIYAPFNSKVLSAEDGEVIDIGVFTSPKMVPYWNKTFYIIIKNKSGFIAKYSELNDVQITKKEKVKAGQVIGYIDSVLNSEKIDKNSPKYIQKLAKNMNINMLHFELYKSLPILSNKYLGGNCLDKLKPENLIDPTDYLKQSLNIHYK